KLILAYLGKAKTLQKTIEDDRLLSTKTSFSSFSKKTKITKEEKLVREQEILDCLNKAYEISQEKSLLNSNELSQDNINAMNKMFDERSKLLEKFKDLSHEVNALKEDGIDTSTIDKNLSDIQTKIIEVLEASEEKTQELLESKREGRTSLSSSLRITSNEDLQKHLAPIYEMMEQMRLDNLRLREEFEFGKKTLEEQQLKLESLEEKGQIVLEKNQVSLEDKLDEQEEIASVGEDQALLPNLTSARIIQNQYRSPVSNNTSIVANAYEESIRDQRDTNSSMHKTYVISKITYDNPLLNFLAKEENKEIEEKIIQKHGARDLSKLIDIFDPINSTEQDRAESQATEPLPFSILGKVPEESSELDQG
ncbi:MAG: hypothetical protein SFT93_03320, partial [Rickettsiaceae bacterium]|nr:hypothetical protein [Rickettsiaceae bacterium]